MITLVNALTIYALCQRSTARTRAGADVPLAIRTRAPMPTPTPQEASKRYGLKAKSKRSALQHGVRRERTSPACSLNLRYHQNHRRRRCISRIAGS